MMILLEKAGHRSKSVVAKPVEEMKVATSYAIASLIPESELREDNIIPSALNKDVAKVVAEAVVKAAKDGGVARI